MAAAPEVIDMRTPLNEQLRGIYKQSFAYVTLSKRLLNILDQALQQIAQDTVEILDTYGDEAASDLEDLQNSVVELKEEIATNKEFTHFEGNSPDIEKWNKFLTDEERGGPIMWFSTVWLYSECYMYRRLRQAVENTEILKEFDPFHKQKENSLFNSYKPMVVLSDWLVNEFKNHPLSKEPRIKVEFIRFLHASVWGNKCDLSLSCGTQIQHVTDPLKLLEELAPNILVDKSYFVWQLLSKPRTEECTVDIILDNAGYELFTDLCFADFMCTFKLTDKVCFHFKTIPWFVSDAMIKDFQWTLSVLEKCQNEYASLATLGHRWREYICNGTWSCKAEDYWTLPYIYSDMKTIDPELYEYLTKSKLLLFKGDLNYRKLIGEVNWEPTLHFNKALQDFHPTNLVALRTIKADLICGLSPDQAQDAAAADANWMLTGNYAVIQFDGSDMHDEDDKNISSVDDEDILSVNSE